MHGCVVVVDYEIHYVLLFLQQCVHNTSNNHFSDNARHADQVPNCAFMIILPIL